jgi:hypothetical protein
MRGFRSTLASSKTRVKSACAHCSKPCTQVNPSSSGALGSGRRPQQGLLLEGVALRDLVTQFGSPLHVVHAARLRDNARRFQAVPAGATGGCEVFYSYKTNPIEAC